MGGSILDERKRNGDEGNENSPKDFKDATRRTGPGEDDSGEGIEGFEDGQAGSDQVPHALPKAPAQREDVPIQDRSVPPGRHQQQKDLALSDAAALQDETKLDTYSVAKRTDAFGEGAVIRDPANVEGASPYQEEQPPKERRPLKKIALFLIPVLLVALAVFFITMGNSAKSEEIATAKVFEDGLLPVRIGSKWGFVNTKAEFVINLQFDSAGSFFNGRAIVTNGDKYGAIDTNGKYVINPQFAYMEPSDDGTYRVLVGDKWGMVDRDGKMIVNPIYGMISKYQNGMAAVSSPDSFSGDDVKYGFVDRQGNLAVNMVYEEVGNFNEEGYAPVKSAGRWGIINKQGAFTVNPIYTDSFSLNRDLNPAQFGNRCLYLNKSGGIVLDQGFEEGSIFSENSGTASVRVGGKYGFIDQTGKIVIQPQFDEAQAFHENVAVVVMDNKYGVIDTTGKFIVNPVYDMVRGFEEGLCPVKQGESWGIVDRSGNLVVAPQFEFIQHRVSDLNAIVMNDMVGYVDRNGKLLINPQFDTMGWLSAYSFGTDGYAVVKSGDKMGVIDNKGNYLISPQFDEIGVSYLLMEFDY